MGYHQMELKVETADDWIIILDESVEFGHEKLLVIYGVRSNQIDFSRALNFKDLTPLSIIAWENGKKNGMFKEWDENGKIIKEELYKYGDLVKSN